MLYSGLSFIRHSKEPLMTHEPAPNGGERNKAVMLQNEHGFQWLLEKLPAATYTCDAEGLITYYNAHAVQLWGRAPKLHDSCDRFCGSFKLFTADGVPIDHSQCWMAKALATGNEFNGEEIVVERPDGSRRTALAHANPIVGESGELLGALNILVDITDRKRADEVQTLLAAIVESSDDAIVSKTLDGRILSWNRGAERLFGYTAEEAIGKSITLIIPPERHDEERGILARLHRGERIDHYETVRVAKDGRRLDISLTISPLRDATGRFIGASKVGRDVTARKQADKALVAAKNELAAQLADVQRLHEMSMLLSTTLELQPILDVTLRTAATVEGADMGFVSLRNEDKDTLEIGAILGFDEDFRNAIDEAPTGTGAFGACYQSRRRVVIEDVDTDPRYAPFLHLARRGGFRAVHCTPLITRLGRMVGVLSMHFRQPHRPSERETRLIDLCARQAVDFIENARLYNALKEADRRKDEFLAVLGHELRNPLAPICNSLHVLRLTDDLSPAVAHMRDIIERQVSQMVRLLDDLLEVSRITCRKIELRKEQVEVAAILRNAIEASRPLMEAAGHQLAIHIHPEPMTLYADPVRLTQVVANLLNNSAKYTKQGGQIWLTARRTAHTVFISVRDSGIGIQQDLLPHVFDLFTQGDTSALRGQSGLGIGLTLVKRLVQMHGGRVEAHSQGPGQGSEFTVELPLTAGIEQSTVPLYPPAADARELPRRRILVVDDTEAGLYTLAKLLATLGQDVQTAPDAESALDAARAARPDVVISDIGMPGMDGYELARQLRREADLAGVVLIALTGYGQDSHRQAALDAGYDYHLVKPVSLNALQDLLATLPISGVPTLAEQAVQAVDPR
jgi:PAS domain S-box-containing protein